MTKKQLLIASYFVPCANQRTNVGPDPRGGVGGWGSKIGAGLSEGEPAPFYRKFDDNDVKYLLTKEVMVNGRRCTATKKRNRPQSATGAPFIYSRGSRSPSTCAGAGGSSTWRLSAGGCCKVCLGSLWPIRSGKTTFKSPKTAGSRRTITLPAITVEALKEHRSARPRIGAGELVFSHDGIPWDPDSLTKAFDKLIRECGLGASPFTVCDTHISHQLMDGVHVKVVSERAGHANVGITLSVYAAFVPTLQEDAAAGVDLWLRENLAEQVGDKSVTIRPFPTQK